MICWKNEWNGRPFNFHFYEQEYSWVFDPLALTKQKKLLTLQCQCQNEFCWMLKKKQNIFQNKIDTSFEFSFACFMNEGPRKYCHIDCIAKWLSFKWLMNVAWTALWLLGTVVTIIEILKKNYEPYKRNNYYSLRSK